MRLQRPGKRPVNNTIGRILAACLLALFALAGMSIWLSRPQNSYRATSISVLPPSSSFAGNLYGTGSNPHDHYVRPHVTKNGVYISGHYQTNPNGTQRDNYGTLGDVNPHTGAVGTKIPRY